MIVELTKQFLETGLTVPAGEARIEYCDSVCPGLLIEVRAVASTIPVYYLRFKRNGKTAYDRLGTILKSDSNRPVCNILMFLLTTGARLGEVLKLTDDQLDMEKGLWTIPAANAKSKKSRTVPLNDSALFVLAEAGKLQKTQYVFANPDTGKPFTTITRVRHRLQKLAGVTMRAHSLRHQFADMLLAGGRSLYDVQILLGHSDPRVSQRYAKLSMNALQQASSVASILVPKTQATPTTPSPSATSPEPAEAVLAQVEGIATSEQITPKQSPASNVVPFPKAA